MNANRRNHRLALLILIIGVTIWGAGFVFTNMCKVAGSTPSFTNMVRFVTASVLIGIIFHKRIKATRPMLLFGFLGGTMLFAAFMLQVAALEYTTPANNGFFTAGYIVFVPFMVWILNKKSPSLIVWIGVIVAVIGMFILSFGNSLDNTNRELAYTSWIGDLMTIACALFFAFQMIISDRILRRENTDAINFTFWQILFAATLFTLYFLIIDTSVMQFDKVDWVEMLLPLSFLAILGTAYAYPAQINAQKYLSPSETSLIMSCESVIGAIFSVIVGYDRFSWALVVGGLLVTLAVIIVEVVPNLLKRTRRNRDKMTFAELEAELIDNNIEADTANDPNDISTTQEKFNATTDNYTNKDKQR